MLKKSTDLAILISRGKARLLRDVKVLKFEWDSSIPSLDRSLYLAPKGLILTRSLIYRKSPIKPPGGLIFFQALLRGGGGLNREGELKREEGFFNFAKRITCSKNTVVWDRVDLRVVQLQSLSKVFNSLVGA